MPQPDQALPLHWERGGYPDSYLAADGESSMQWRGDFITSYVERYLPQQGITAAPIQLRRFCSMLAHQQGATVNLSKLAGSLGIDGKTARRYLDLLEGPGLVESMETPGSSRGFIVIPDGEAYPLSKSVTATGLGHFLEKPL